MAAFLSLLSYVLIIIHPVCVTLQFMVAVLYPTYHSIVAIHYKLDKKLLLKYWIVYGTLTLIEECLTRFIKVTVLFDIIKLGIYGLNVYYTMNKIYSIKRKEEFIQQSKVKNTQKKKHSVSLNKVTTRKKIETIKKAEQITNDVLSKKPSGDPSKKDTVLHVFNEMLGGNALMYDSSKGVNCPDNENMLMTQNMDADEKEDPEFCVTLSSLDGECKNDSKVDENDTMVELNKCIKKDKSHPILNNFREKIAKAYNIKPSQVIIKDVYAGSVNIVYSLDLTHDQRKKYFKKDGSGNITETSTVIDKMSELFRDFQSLNLPAIFYRNSFDIAMFDDRGNKIFSNGTTYKVGPRGREKEYIQPTGWVRYGLKVLNKYPDKKWLHPFQDAGNWYRVYHGTGTVDGKTIPGYGYNKMNSIDAMSSIYKGGFHMAGAIMYGHGVYCSPDPKWLESSSYCGKISIDTQNGAKTYKYMLQCGVNPDQVRCGNNTNHSNKTYDQVPFGSSDIFQAYGPIWVAQNPDSIRAYGILIKEV